MTALLQLMYIMCYLLVSQLQLHHVAFAVEDEATVELRHATAVHPLVDEDLYVLARHRGDGLEELLLKVNHQNHCTVGHV